MTDKTDNTLFGHPPSLFTLFFVEMWERFSYYGMRSLLIFYMIKGFLGYNDHDAYGIYAAYGALVYATPFIGGMLADRLLGARKAVILGGLLMSAGHLLMTIENKTSFFIALALLICGNGFFKPNISTIVGTLYPDRSSKRDGGFTIFYMGVNLGAAMSPLICGYVGETYGWHYGFGLATIGMLVGVATFVMPRIVTQALILVGALGTGIAMFFLHSSKYQLMMNAFVGIVLIIAGIIAVMALNKGVLPKTAGAPPDPEALKKKLGGILRMDWSVYLGVIIAVPVIAFIVQRNTVAGWVLTVFGLLAFISVFYFAVTSKKVERERLFVVLILTFFSLLFWAFFEQGGSSINNFTDRNVDRVFDSRVITQDEVGKTIEIKLNQEQLGYKNGDQLINLNVLDKAREENNDVVQWTVDESHIGMEVGGDEIKASIFQSVNPIFIILFGLPFTALWGFLAARRKEPSTPVKFAWGFLQLGMGFVALWYGAVAADDRGMVWMGWLWLGYLLHTTGELCLSPVGLSMITRLSPARIVSTVMGSWFMATAFSGFLAGVIARLTGVGHSEGGENIIPPPSETVMIYGTVYGQIGMIAVGSALVILALSPLLKRWMHEGEE